MDEVTTDHEMDLSGEVCPYTFVRSKLMLEKMDSGLVLGVKVDNGESASNVPRSMELEGHTVLDVQEIPGGWWILVRKG